MKKSKSVPEKITDKLNEYDIEIYKVSNQSNQTTIMAENLIASFKDNELLINFHVTSKASYAARVILILKEIKNIKKVLVGEDFIFDNYGKYLEGEEADKVFEEFQTNTVINNFLNEQKTLYLLTHAEGYRC